MRQERAMLIKQEFFLIPIQIPMLITVFPRIIAGVEFLFSHKKGALIIRGSRLFQILLTGRRALIIRIFYSLFFH